MMQLRKSSAKPLVLYADMSNNAPEYQALVNAQLETWAAGAFSEDRFYAVTGQGSPSLPTKFQTALLQTDCMDSYTGIACKEFNLLKSAYERQPDVLAIVGEDNYVNTTLLEENISKLALGEMGPTFFGIKGCSLMSRCPELPDAVSVCGGGGLFMNRAALNLLFADGPDVLSEEYNRKAGLPNDVITSCALQKRGAALMDWHQGIIGNRLMTIEEHRAVSTGGATGPMVLHYLTTPAVFHWTYAMMRGEAQEADVFEQEAFGDDGCCCWYREKPQDCHALGLLTKAAAFGRKTDIGLLRIQPPRVTRGEEFYNGLARLYIEEENAKQ